MPYNDDLADEVRAYFNASAVPFEEKRMFGGLCFMVNEKMCVGVETDRLMVRIDPDIQAECLTRPGCKPMDFTGKPMKGYVFVEYDGEGRIPNLSGWLKLALEFNPKAKPSRKRR